MSKIKLTGELIEGFVLSYLHSRFDEPAPVPDMHREMWADACAGHPRLAWAGPRNSAKSTAITHCLTLAETMFGVEDFGLILSGTYDAAVKYLKDIKSELYSNDELIADFGPIKFERDTEDEIIVSCYAGRFCLMARGAEQDVRGLKWEGKRPGVITFDDAETDDMVMNPERRIKFRERVLNVWLPMGNDSVKVRWVDTIKHFDSFLERLMTDSMWKTRRYRAHKGFDDFSELLWPEKWPEAKLREKRQLYINQGNENGYSREYLNQPMVMQGAYFRPDDSLAFRDEDYKGWEKGELTFIASADFAFTISRRSDYTVFIVAGLNDNGDILIGDVRREKMASDGIVEDMINLTMRYDLQMFGVPGGKDFETFRPFLEGQMADADDGKGVYVPVEIVPDTKDKPSKCQAFRGYHRMGKVRFDKKAEWWLTVDDEMRCFTAAGAMSGHDDVIDALGILGNIVRKASRPDTPEEADDMFWAQAKKQERQGRNRTTGY